MLARVISFVFFLSFLSLEVGVWGITQWTLGFVV